MRTIMLCQGLPSCGKSTFARELLKKEPNRWKRVNRDDLRAMIDDGQYSRDNEDFIRTVQDDFVRQAIRNGFDVIIDNTHLVPLTVKKLHRLAESIGDVKVIHKTFNVSVEECLKRNATRTGSARVPDKVIIDMASKAGLDGKRRLEDKEAYYPPRWLPGGAGADPVVMEQDANLPKAIMCDLDGTLSLLNGRNPYDASTCDMDMPNTPVIECVKAMHAASYRVVFMSGRDDRYREPTERFIKKHLLLKNNIRIDGDEFSEARELEMPDTVMPYELYMRPAADQRKDSIVKGELFDAHVRGRYNVAFVLDDRDSVVDEWRRMGLTVYQVAPGAF